MNRRRLVSLLVLCSTAARARGERFSQDSPSDATYGVTTDSSPLTSVRGRPSSGGTLRATRSLIETQIVGGDPVGSQKYPFFVQSDASTSGFVCGGSLVAKDFVLTAAHCASAYNGSTRVLVGPYERDSEDGPSEWRTRVGDVQVHPGFDMSHMRHDLMLIRIQPVTLSNLVPIRLNLNPDVPSVGQSLVAIGMGVNDDGVTSNVLEGVTLTAVSDRQCYDEWTAIREIDRESMVCASTTGGKDVCGGDSGGPLFDSQRRLVGVVSFGPSDPCANPVISGVYARVSGAQAWLKQVVCKQSSFPPSDLCQAGNNGGGSNAGSTVAYRVVVQYGQWAELLGWKLVRPTSKNKGRTVAQVPRGAVRQSYARRQKGVRLAKGAKYNLVVRQGGEVAGPAIATSSSGWVKLYRNRKLVRTIRFGPLQSSKVFKFRV